MRLYGGDIFQVLCQDGTPVVYVAPTPPSIGCQTAEERAESILGLVIYEQISNLGRCQAIGETRLSKIENSMVGN